jgi:hypothetical protein
MVGAQDRSITASQDVAAHDARREPRLDQRRRRIIILRIAERETLLTLRNISFRGVSGTVADAVASNAPVTLVFEGGRQSGGQVRWSRGLEVGIELSAPLPLAVLAGPPPGQTARERRFQVRRSATLIINGQARGAVIRNVSTTGMLVESGCHLAPGQSIDICCGQALRLSAQVRWSDRGRAGLRLAQPLCLTAFDEATS